VNKHIKTSLAPGSRIVTEYLEKAGLLPYLEKLGFSVAAYGCTTCIGNAGDLTPEINEAITKNDLVCAAVLSGNRNFEARIHPNLKANFLASPPLVVAYAIAGTVTARPDDRTRGQGHQGQGHLPGRHLADQRRDRPADEVRDERPRLPRQLREGQERARQAVGEDLGRQGRRLHLAQEHLHRRAALLRRLHDAAQGAGSRRAGRAHHGPLFGDSITTDHISPAGSFKDSTPAGRYLLANGVLKADFNSYGSRRGNHEVMMRGTFANVRIKNLMLPPQADGSREEGGTTLHQPGARRCPSTTRP
jgi:aconitate hydratase